MREWGLDAQIEEQEALMPYPTVRQLELTEPVHTARNCRSRR